MLPLNLPEKLLTERLILQRLRYEDAEEIFYTYASKPDATKFVSWPTHESLEDTRAFLRYVIHAWSIGKDYSFSIRLRESNRLIGSFGILNEHGNIQFGYAFSPTQWGNGYATETCRYMMDLLKKTEGKIRIQTFVDVDNVASKRVLLKSGLVQEEYMVAYYKFVNQGNSKKDCILFKLP
jgi:[ribosomal protein S5]-alanine N-acetyltransferase